MKDIFSYNDLVSEEGFNVQRSMNYRPQNKNYSIFLMSASDDSPYNDGFSDNGKTLFYEGEDLNKREVDSPKKYDQPLFTKTGKLTNNAIFFKATENYKTNRRIKPEEVRVYEKLDSNVWSDKGWFNLVDVQYRQSEEENRKVFKFILQPKGSQGPKEGIEKFEFSRRIPTNIKRIVWERDKGRCAKCGTTNNLHFDHIIPFSKGGSSTNPKNIQILCNKHNLKKSDKIE